MWRTINTERPFNAISCGDRSRFPECSVGRFQQARRLLPTPGRLVAGTLTIIGTLLLYATPARAIDAKKVFNSRCTACHTFGHGVKVGPDLKGVTVRRQRPWLLKFIRGSQGVIKSGDPVAADLFKRFKRQRMPDWSDLSPDDVSGILDWLAAAGPEQRDADERDAETATAADVARGRGLFDGTSALASDGVACASCHSVREGKSRHGGTLGPDLTGTFQKYRDRALTTYLKRPCTPREPELGNARYLTPEEAFALKGYLRQLSIPASPLARGPQ